MGLFDKIKNKSLEKMVQKMSGGADPQAMLKSMGASDADIAGAMQAMKGMSLSSLMGMMKAFTPGVPVSADKIREVFDPAMLQQFASKLNVNLDQAPEKIAEIINLAMTQSRSSK